MPPTATIDAVIGSGGNPPTSIRVRGTVSGCEYLFITLVCGTTSQVFGPITISAGTWGPEDLPSGGCQCGDPIQIILHCTTGGAHDPSQPALAIWNGSLICEDCCPALSLDTPQVSGCAPVNATAQFNATLTWPAVQGCQTIPVTGYNWTINGPTGKFQRYIAGAAGNQTNTTSGWKTTQGGTTRVGPVDLSKSGSFSVTVTAKISGLPEDCNPTDTQSFQVPICSCPTPATQNEWQVTNTTAPLGPNRFQTLDCDVAHATITFSVDPGGLTPSQILYTWDFGDGSQQVSQPGPGGATQRHAYTNQPAGQTQTYEITVTVTVPSNPNCLPLIRKAYITVPGCITMPPAPRVIGCTVTPGQGSGQVQVHFDRDVEPSSATNPANFSLQINNGTAFNPSPGTLSYDPSTHTTTISGLSLNNGDRLDVTVTGVRDASGTTLIDPSHNTTYCTAACKSGEHWDASQGKCVSDSSNGGFNWCCLLIWGWLVTFVSIWYVVLYWPALLSAVGTSLILLILWFLLCQGCGWKFWTKEFWDCIHPLTNCCFLTWTIFGHQVALAALGYTATIYSPPTWVWTVLTVSLSIWTYLWWKAGCKNYPLVVVPSTWPDCNCKG